MDPSKILVIRRDNIGDLVCTTPQIRALRARFPGARLDALVNSYNGPVLAGNPDLDHVYAYTKGKHRETGESLLAAHTRRLGLLWRLRRVGYDLVILAGDGDTVRARQLAHWLAPGRILRFADDRLRGGGADLTVAVEPAGLHAVEVAFRLLAPLGIVGEPPALRLVPPAAAMDQARAALAGTPGGEPTAKRVAIHISARKPSQRWPKEFFVELMRCLHDDDPAVVFLLFWSPGAEDNPLHPGDDGKAAEIMAEAGDLPIIPYATHRLDELISGLALCERMVCSDGGAMHVGAALGLPIVCFFGQSDTVRWRPWGVPHVLLQTPSKQVADITVDQALAAYRQLPERADAG